MPPLFAIKDLLKAPVTRATYSDRTAWLMASFSKLAYEPADKVKSGLERIGYRYLRFIPRQDTECFLGEGPDLAVLSFRGTEPRKIKDIVTDLDCDFNKDESGMVLHDGFLKAFNAIKDEIVLTLRRITKPLYITGHSLGGALASVVTYFLEKNEYTIASCYTYGSPRTGGQNFASTLEKTPIYRIVNATDIVPRVPLKVQKYIHVGGLYYLNDAGRLFKPTEGSNIISEAEFYKAIGGSLMKQVMGQKLAMIAGAKPLLKNHSIDNYIAKLEKIALNRN